MPYYLYLLRHGQAAEKQVNVTDKARELTPGGIKQAILIGYNTLIADNPYLTTRLVEGKNPVRLNNPFSDGITPIS